MKRVILGIIITIMTISCSSLPTKEVEIAKKELEKAKQAEADALAPYDYQIAEENYNKAESFIKEKKGDEAKKHSETSIGSSRKSILSAKDKKTKESIDKFEAKLNSIKSMEYTGEVKVSKDIAKEVYDKLEIINKIKPYEEKLNEAKSLYNKAKELTPQIEKDINKTEEIKELQDYIKLMNDAYNKVKEMETQIAEELKQADNEFKEKYEAAMLMTEINTKISKGDEIVDTLNKDEFVNTFYKEEKEKAISEFMAFKESVKNNPSQSSEGYDKLMAFYNQMVETKEKLRITFSLLTQNIVDKTNAFYKQEAESYLEKAERLRREVYNLYKKEMLQEMKPNTVKSLYIAQEDKEEKLNEETENKDKNDLNKDNEKNTDNTGEKITEEKKEESLEEDKIKKAKTPEEAMLNQLDYLYENATAEYEKENYYNSIEKAKEAIDLAEKMIALKKDKSSLLVEKSVIKEYKKYTVLKGDCLWKISMKNSIYGKAYLWPIIWYANKDTIKNPHIIEPKMTLNIPVFK